MTKAFPFLSLSCFICKTRAAISASRGAGQMEMVKGFRSDSCRHLPRIWGDTRSCESGLWDWAGGDAVSVETCIMEFWGGVLAGFG